VIPAQAGIQQVSFLRKQGPRLPWVCPLVSSLRKQESSRCHPCASRNPVRLSPPRERPAVPKAPPGEGATVSFLRKQEPRLLWVFPLVSFLRKRQSRLLCTHPPCPSCVSSSPVRLSPGGRGPPASLTGCGGDVSFLRKQKSRKKTWIPTFVAVPRKWPPHEAKVFWPERGSELALFATHPPLWGHAFRSL
jgi:hypothetical protein